MDAVSAQLADVRRELAEHMDSVVILTQLEFELEQRWKRAWLRCSNIWPPGDAA